MRHTYDRLYSGADMDKEQWPDATVGTVEFDFDPETVEAAAEDFGHLVRRRPAAVHRPASTQDVARAVRWAVQRRMPLAARGQGHSVYGRAQAENGLVIDMTGLDAVHAVEPDRVIVDAGATWQHVLEATLPHGLTPPVLTDYLALSVGGTVSVGGLGGTTFRSGFQSCNVIELEVVTGRGDIVTCSPNRHPELFHAVRAGLGQFGIITRAVLRLQPAPERVRLHTLFYPDARAMTADQRRLLATGQVDYLEGAIRPHPSGWEFVIETAVGYAADSLPDDDATLAGLSDDRARAESADMSYVELYQRLSKLEVHLRAVGAWHDPHPWHNSFLPDPVTDEVVADLLTALRPEDLGEFGRVLLYPIAPGRADTPLLRLPEGGIAFVCNLIRFPANDPALVDRLVKANRAVYDRVRAAGGYGYPVSAVALTQADWKEHFGPLWPTIEQAKASFDPGHLLSPGQGMFSR
ncbi:FAD-binding protein [Nonomuraea sp. B1E8]|uniref:FAD-binding protein n=1 Tax=unclassified Nonomuraea TaxID=2593643 RepID=UPI00325F8720